MQYIGCDVSMNTLDFSGYNSDEKTYHYTLTNDNNGFNNLLAKLPEDACVVMEATGVYYLQLAHFLIGKGYQVSVINPLVIRRFSQMKMRRTKTDAKDAELILAYATLTKSKVWKPNQQAVMHISHKQTILEGFIKQRRAVLNQLHALEKSPYADAESIKILEDMIDFINKKIEELEKNIQKIAETHYGHSLQLLKTIPGIGNKTAICLIALTNNFEKFDHVKKLISYVGLAPRIFESGTSVRGKGKICKMGMSRIRKLLYMCSWTAKTCNQPCKELYERLKTKGKPERVIKIAIANKLLRQAFAIAKNNSPFKPNFHPNPCF